MSAQTQAESEESRIEKLIAYEGKYQDLEKIAIETMCRTGRDPLFCFELALSLQHLRKRIIDERRKRGALR